MASLTMSAAAPCTGRSGLSVRPSGGCGGRSRTFLVPSRGPSSTPPTPTCTAASGSTRRPGGSRWPPTSATSHGTSSPRLGHLPLARIRPLDVRSWLADEVAAGIAPTSVHRHFCILRRLLRVAVESDLLVKSPCAGIKPPPVEPVERRFLTAAEVHRLAEEIQPHFRVLVYTADYAGLRRPAPGGAASPSRASWPTCWPSSWPSGRSREADRHVELQHRSLEAGQAPGRYRRAPLARSPPHGGGAGHRPGRPPEGHPAPPRAQQRPDHPRPLRAPLPRAGRRHRRRSRGDLPGLPPAPPRRRRPGAANPRR